MTKFIIENKGDKYVMSFIDDYLPTSTKECESIDWAIHEMTNIFNNRKLKSDVDTVKSMTNIRDLYSKNKLNVELLGIDLINSDSLRKLIISSFGDIALNYCLKNRINSDENSN